MNGRNIVLALALSMSLTLGLAFVYILWPFMSAVLWSMVRNPGIGGIDVVAGGVSSRFLIAMLVLEPFLFLIIFGLLQTKHTRR